MKWFWKVRCYFTNGGYATYVVTTNRDLREIDAVQDAYLQLTGCKMLLEGMAENSEVVWLDLAEAEKKKIFTAYSELDVGHSNGS